MSRFLDIEETPDLAIDEIRTALGKLVNTMIPLEKIPVTIASDNNLNAEFRSTIGERWSRLDGMAENYHDRIEILATLPRW